MVRIIKKRALFMIGVLLTGIVGSVSSLVRNNFSRDSSLFFDLAHADVPAPVIPSGDSTGGDACAGGAGGGAGGDAGGDAGCCDGCY